MIANLMFFNYEGIVMKKHIVFLSFMLAIASQGLFGIDIAQEMKTAAQYAFGEGCQIFEQPINNANLAPWNNSLNEYKGRVADYNQKKKSKMINDYLSQIDSANNDLINGIKVAYNGMYSSKTVAGNQPKFVKVFTDISKNMARITAAVGSVKTQSDEERSMYNIIGQLTSCIGRVADDAIMCIMKSI